MPPTLVNVAVGVLLGCALLGAAFDRRSVAIVALAAALPDADALLGLVFAGATNAALHSVFVPGIAAILLYWDTERRETSWIRGRWGGYGVRVAWVALASYLLAGIGLDLFAAEGVALLYPVSEAMYRVSGRLVLSTQEGLVHTYVRPESDGILPFEYLEAASDNHVETWVAPTPDGVATETTERRIGIVESGYQLVIVITAAATLLARTVAKRRCPIHGRTPGGDSQRGGDR